MPKTSSVFISIPLICPVNSMVMTARYSMGDSKARTNEPVICPVNSMVTTTRVHQAIRQAIQAPLNTPVNSMVPLTRLFTPGEHNRQFTRAYEVSFLGQFKMLFTGCPIHQAIQGFVH